MHSSVKRDLSLPMNINPFATYFLTIATAYQLFCPLLSGLGDLYWIKGHLLLVWKSCSSTVQETTRIVARYAIFDKRVPRNQKQWKFISFQICISFWFVVKAKKSQHFIKPISCHGLILTKGKSPISCTGGLLFLETLLGYTIARKLSKSSSSSSSSSFGFSLFGVATARKYFPLLPVDFVSFLSSNPFHVFSCQKSSMARIKSFSCLAISFFHRVLSNMLKNEIVENQIVGTCWTLNINFYASIVSWMGTFS